MFLFISDFFVTQVIYSIELLFNAYKIVLKMIKRRDLLNE